MKREKEEVKKEKPKSEKSEKQNKKITGYSSFSSLFTILQKTFINWMLAPLHYQHLQVGCMIGEI